MDAQQATLTAFDRATAVEPLGGGRYAASVDAGWSAPAGPNGGYIAAVIVRALEAEVARGGERQLRSFTCHYMRPPMPGEIEILVEELRSGRRFSTARFSARQGEREVLSGIASLSAGELAEVASWSPAPPRVASSPSRDAGTIGFERYRFDDAEHWLKPMDGMPEIVHRVKLAPRIGGVPFSGRRARTENAVETGGWVTLPEPRAIDASYLALCTDVWWPAAFSELEVPALAPTIDLTVHIRARVPAGGISDQPVLGCYRTSAAIGGLIDEDGMLFGADGALLAQSRQLALLAPLDGAH